MGQDLGMPAKPQTGPGTFQDRGRSRLPLETKIAQRVQADSGRAGLWNFPRAFFPILQLQTGAEQPRIPAMPTETERCIESLLAVFQRYAGREGDACTLSKREFRAFMDTELAAFTKNQKDPGVVDRMMKKLDMNSDGQLDFQEFLNLIGGIAVACHDSLVLKAPKP
ncbi:protein S100-A11-like [Passer montanus]|uniref:protein S100-A11-like n=1 Tax=Passer montanus TaxID=9160 RepID=UPI00195FF43C|nr:protein S100-A11-like [Passer montanus]